MGNKTVYKVENTDNYSKIERIDEQKDGNLKYSTILINKNTINLQIQ